MCDLDVAKSPGLPGCCLPEDFGCAASPGTGEGMDLSPEARGSVPMDAVRAMTRALKTCFPMPKPEASRRRDIQRALHKDGAEFRRTVREGDNRESSARPHKDCSKSDRLAS